MEKVNAIKAIITATLAAATALWGWFGWLVAMYVICMALDYIAGSVAAGLKGEWNSSVARIGIRHKLGSIIAISAAGIADLVVRILLDSIPFAMPFDYAVAICPVVVAWYIITELGSIVENAERLGAPIPPFFRQFLAICKSGVEKTEETLGTSGEVSVSKGKKTD